MQTQAVLYRLNQRFIISCIGALLAVSYAQAQLPAVAIKATDALASEAGTDTAAFNISRTGNLDAALTVFYGVSGTASNGVDFDFLPGSVTVQPGASNAFVVVQPIDDILPETYESVVVALKTNTAYTVASPSSASATILDNDNLPPTITLIAPVNGTILTGPTNVVIQASAIDPDGWIRNVNFYSGGAYIGGSGNGYNLPPSNTVSTYTLVWSNVVSGHFTLSASAYDNLNAMATSAPVNLTVNLDPGVSLIRITASDAYAAEPGADTGLFTISRTGNTSQAVTVYYAVGGTATAGADYTALTGSVTLPANTLSAGVLIQPLDDALVEPSETVTLTLVDDPAYFILESRTATVYLRDNETNTPPAVTFTAPLDGATFKDPSSIPLTADATDSDGSIVRVDFYANNLLIASDTNSPFGITWTSMVPGAYSLKAKATDNMGAATTSQPVNITVDRTPMVRFSVLDGSASEPGTDTATIQAYRFNNTNIEVTVNYTVGGTAIAGVDYETLTGSVTLPAGVTTVPIVIRPIDDTLLEQPTESVILTLSSNVAYLITDPRTATVTIRDNEINTPPAVALTAPLDGATFKDPSSIPLTADASDSDGSVVRVDFYANNLLIASDTNSPFGITWTSMVPGTYVLKAKATDNMGATTTSQPVNITVDRTPMVRFNVSDSTASEPGTDTATIQAYRFNNTNIEVTVNYTVGGTAIAGVDYETLTGSVTLPAGVTTVPIVIRPIDDTLLEQPTESVILTLSSNVAYLITDPRTATVTIRDNEINTPPAVALTAPLDGASFKDPSSIPLTADASDSDGSVVRVDFYANNLLIASDTNSPFGITWTSMVPGTYILKAKATDNMGAATTSQPVSVTVDRTPMVRFNVSDATAAEPGTDTATIQAYRFNNTNIEVTVNYTVGGTAIAGIDYETLTGSVTLPAGVTTVPIVIRPIDDTLLEQPTESVILTLSSNVAYLITDPRTATVTIRDNETNTPPAVTLTAPVDGAAYVDPSNIVLTADASDSDGSVTRVDFYANDLLVGSDTSAPYSMVWSSMMQGSYVLRAKATDQMSATTFSAPLTVTVQRTPVVHIYAVDYNASEPGADTATIQVSRSFNTNQDLVVSYTIGGTASNGVDYVALPGSVTIPAGVFATNLVIQPLDDAMLEPTETVILSLAGQATYLVGDPRTALVYIKDNETNSPPTVALTAPANDSSFADPTNILITASASDLDGRVMHVDFFANSLMIGSSTNASASIHWSNMSQGSYVLSARAYDDLGLSATSQPITVTVIRTPVVRIVALDAYASEPGSDTATVQVSRAYNTNQNLTVYYTVSGTASNGLDYVGLTGVTTLPAGVSVINLVIQPIDDLSPESTETVIVTLSSNTAYSATEPRSAIVYLRDNDTNQPPVVTLTAPSNNTEFKNPTNIILTADASDIDGSVARVDFYVDTLLIGSASNSPYTARWSSTSSGNTIMGQGIHTLTAKATDNLGATTVSPSVTITVVRTPIIQVYATDLHASEVGADPGAFTVYRRENTNQDLIVYYGLGGTASNGTDYTTLSGSVTLSAGVSTAVIVVQPIADGPEPEPTIETVTLFLLPDAAYQISSPTQAILSIYNEITTNVPPTVRLVTPTNGASFKVPATVELTAEAADPDGVVTKVDFLVNSVLIGTRTNTPYTMPWTNAATGYFLLSVRATDNRGATTLSTPARVLAFAIPTPSASRYLPLGYVPGVKLLVVLGISQPASTFKSFSVAEQPPEGWLIDSINAGGRYDQATDSVQFGPITTNTTQILTYEVIPPPDATGVQNFTGVLTTDENIVPVGGTSLLSPVPPHPADNDGTPFVMTLDEATAYCNAWKAGERIASNSIVIGYVARAGYLWNNGEVYTVSTNYPTPTPPMLWVTNAAAATPPTYGNTGYGATVCSMPSLYTTGQSFTVTLVVTPAQTGCVYAIEEHLPTGWRASNISDQGVFSSATASIRWGLFLDEGSPYTVSYDVMPSTNAVTYGAFSGITSFDGVNVPITGVRKTSRNP